MAWCEMNEHWASECRSMAAAKKAAKEPKTEIKSKADKNPAITKCKKTKIGVQ